MSYVTGILDIVEYIHLMRDDLRRWKEMPTYCLFISRNLEDELIKAVAKHYGNLVKEYSHAPIENDCDFMLFDLKGYWIDRYPNILEIC